MARRLVLMSVLPRVMVSEAKNLAGSVCSAMALRVDLEVSQAAPRPEAERTRNSRRRMGDPPDDVGASIKGYTNSGDPRKVKGQSSGSGMKRGYGGRDPSTAVGLCARLKDQSSLRMTNAHQMRNGAASRRKGRVMARKTSSRTPWTATPTMRNGSRSSQTKG